MIDYPQALPTKDRTMFNRIRRDRPARTRSLSRRFAVEMLEGRALMTAVIFNPAGSAQPKTQTNTFTITNPAPTTETITVAVTQLGSGNGTLSKTSVTLAAGRSTTDVFTPTADSSAADDVEVTETVPGGASETLYYSVCEVTLPKDVKNEDTPTGEADRIPPRTVTEIPVEVTPNLTGNFSGDAIYLAITGGSTNNGKATINDDTYPVQIVKTTTVDLSGTTQTAATGGTHAGNLYLNAETAPGTPVVKSAYGFSVSAIPIAVEDFYEGDISLLHPELGDIGNDDYVAFESDSGDNGDLGGDGVLEQLTVSQTDEFVGTPFAHDTTFQTLTTGTIPGGGSTTYAWKEDLNGVTSASLATPGGTEAVTQYYLFYDARTGSGGNPFSDSKAPIVVDNSGFNFTYDVFYDDTTSAWTLNVTKFGADVGTTQGGSVSDPSNELNYNYTS